MICQLCANEFPKLAKAHLLPDSLKKVTQASGRPEEYLMEVRLNREGKKKRQTHEFDTDILCPACDSSLGPYDEALKRFIRSWYHSPQRGAVASEFIEGSHASVATETGKVMLGLLACLFRCQVSKRCKTVSLGIRYEENLRELFRGQKLQVAPSYFSCKVLGTLRDPDDLCGVMVQPFFRKFNGASIHVFQMYGLMLLTKLGNGVWPIEFKALPNLESHPSNAKILLIPFEGSPLARLIVRASKAQNL